MKLMLILGSDETSDLISLYVNPLGFDLIRYRHVLKAMDNIDEIDPVGIIISAEDFPRHWKILVQFIRNERPKEAFPIVILKGSSFPLEETSKAFYLGVSGIVSETFEDPMEVDRLQSILGRYIPVEEKRKARRFHAAEWNPLGLIIALPEHKGLISGDVKTISVTGISFKPDQPALLKDIYLNMEFSECSMRIGDRILSPSCKVVRTGRIISLEFISFPDNEREILDEYLENLPLRELKSKQKKPAGEQDNGFESLNPEYAGMAQPDQAARPID